MPSTPISRLERDHRYLRWIASFNLLKGLLLLGGAVWILQFLHTDVDTVVGNWMAALRFDLENRYIVKLLERLDLVTDRQLKQLSGLTFFYAGLFLTEGTGLLFRQQWAKYLTLAVTTSFIPLDMQELSRPSRIPTLALLAINIAIAWFLAANLRRDRGPAGVRNLLTDRLPSGAGKSQKAEVSPT